jgi:hypothetical protein
MKLPRLSLRGNAKASNVMERFRSMLGRHKIAPLGRDKPRIPQNLEP